MINNIGIPKTSAIVAAASNGTEVAIISMKDNDP